MAFTQPLDIANLALQHCGVRKIASFTELSKGAAEAARCYDVLRRAELRARLFKFSARTAVLRAIASTSLNMVFPAYVAATTYAAGVITTDNDYMGNSATWISLQASNTGNTPKSSPLYWALYHGPVIADTWDSTLTYYTGEIVKKSSSYYLQGSLATSLNADPASGSPWITLTGASSTAFFAQGPLTANRQSTTLYAYRLPMNYLRIAPQDPKTAGGSFSATSGGMQYSDFEFRGFNVVTSQASPLIFRFGADVYDVSLMDDMFCEMLAAKMAMNLAEILTQRPGLTQALGGVYQAAMAEARKLNQIETGDTETDEAAYIVSRDPEELLQAPAARQ
jgi:hypothetical protein